MKIIFAEFLLVYDFHIPSLHSCQALFRITSKGEKIMIPYVVTVGKVLINQGRKYLKRHRASKDNQGKLGHMKPSSVYFSSQSQSAFALVEPPYIYMRPCALF